MNVVFRNYNRLFWSGLRFHAIDDAISSVVSSDWVELLHSPKRRWKGAYDFESDTKNDDEYNNAVSVRHVLSGGILYRMEMYRILSIYGFVRNGGAGNSHYNNSDLFRKTHRIFDNRDFVLGQKWHYGVDGADGGGDRGGNDTIDTPSKVDDDFSQNRLIY